MSLHDSYARLTPFELAFPERSVLEELSAEVAREAARRGLDDSVPEAFMTMPPVGGLARRIRGPDAPPESTYPFASLLYHGVHFLRAGCPIYLLSTGTVRRLTEPGVAGALAAGEGVDPIATAGYLQLPQHLVWIRGGRSDETGGRGGAPESLDGAFWTVSGTRMLNVLPISGLRPDRPGFGALPLPPAPLSDGATWLGATVRASGDDFAGGLPGGELDDLYAVEAAGEILKLLARFFALAAGGGVTLEAREGRAAGERAHDRSGGPRPSALPYTRVTIAD